MSEQDKSQQTEDATPRKKEKLRDEGKIAKSQDVGAAVVILSVTLTIGAMGESTVNDVFAFATRAFSFQDAHHPSIAVGVFLPTLTRAVAPAMIVAMLGAAIAGVIQTRGLFKLSLILPKAERFNPSESLKKMLPGKESALEIFKQIVKLSAVGAVVFGLLNQSMLMFIGLAASHPLVGAGAVISVASKVALYGAGAFAFIAALDYWLALRKFNEDAKMSMRDIKDEHKQEDGDPMVKRRMRQMARDLIGAGGNVAEATVIVANPTHISIALRYEPDQDAAPMMLARGVDAVAMEMRVVARKHRIPIVENKPLARALFKDGELGKPIPVDLYKAAAEVIAHVLGLRARGI